MIGGVSALDEDTLQFYRSHAQAYAERTIAKHTRLTRFLALLPPGAKVLEWGCGAGAASAEMIAKGFDVEPTDGSPEMAAEASGHLGRPVRTLLFHDIDKADTYDGVWANACLLHVPRPELVQVLTLIWRALLAAISTPVSRPETLRGEIFSIVTTTIHRRIGCEQTIPMRVAGVQY